MTKHPILLWICLFKTSAPMIEHSIPFIVDLFKTNAPLIEQPNSCKVPN